jgi:hypothetical protein
MKKSEVAQVYKGADEKSWQELLDDLRPKGKWIVIRRKLEDGKHSRFIYRCPFCGYVEGYMANFCGKCGADMRGKKE